MGTAWFVFLEIKIFVFTFDDIHLNDVCNWFVRSYECEVGYIPAYSEDDSLPYDNTMCCTG